MPPGLPADLQYLTTLTSGVLAPGLGYWRMTQQCTFFDINTYTSRNPEQQVYIPALGSEHGYDLDNRHDIFTDSIDLEDWDIAVGIQTGFGYKSDSAWALYCRPTGSTRGEWAWRYCLLITDWFSELYGLEEFLGWYARFHEQTEENTFPDSPDPEF